MGEVERPSLNIRRGLFAAGLGAIAGALIPAVLALGYLLYHWSNPDFAPSNPLLDFLADLTTSWFFPVCGGATFLACAAWATYAPPGSWRFATSLLIIFLFGLSSWILVGMLDNWLYLGWLKFYKGEDPNMPRLSQVLVLFGPPAATAKILVMIRAWRTRRSQPVGK